jgi:membrane-associated phospholipid phosphatase
MTNPTEASGFLIRWRARHVVGTLLVAGLALAGLTVIAIQADPGALDLGATRWLQQFQNPAFAALMTAASWFGFAPQNRLLAVVLALPFAARRMWLEAAWIVGSQASVLVTVILKELVHRPRPSPELVGVVTPLFDPSFPSGHVVQYTTVFGTTMFLVYVRFKPSTLRTIALVALAIPILLVGPSRLYLGQHWLSDVLGGYAVSVLLLVPYCWAYVRVASRLSRRAATE